MTIGIIVGVLVALFIVLCFISYVKAPPDKAYIVSGLRRIRPAA